MKIAIIAASLNSKSNSRTLAQYLQGLLEKQSVQVDFIDLRNYPMPLCDGGESVNHPNVKEISARLSTAKAIVIASPIYNYDLNAAVKNLVELTGENAWNEKIVGFICAAGGKNSYMSAMAFANSLMLDFRCLIMPQFIYTARNLPEEPELISGELKQRAKELSISLIKYSSV